MTTQIQVESVIGVIFSPDRNEVLLVERDDFPVWVLPGGGVEISESLENAIIREILEETGFTVKIERLVGLYLPANSLTKPTHLYECTILKGSPKPSAETKQVRFFPRTQLPYPIPPPFTEWIEDAFIIQEPLCKTLDQVNYKTLFFYFTKHPILVFRFVCKKLF
jgi:8-oxo-dGTP diphosphatase